MYQVVEWANTMHRCLELSLKTLNFHQGALNPIDANFDILKPFLNRKFRFNQFFPFRFVHQIVLKRFTQFCFESSEKVVRYLKASNDEIEFD